MRTGKLTWFLLVLAGSAPAQQLSPMFKAGDTPSDRKGFYLFVANPYPTRQLFILTAVEPDLTTPVPGVTLMPARLALHPKQRERIIAVVPIPETQHERKIAVCVMLDQPLADVLPRVCSRLVATRR
jgi:hypothetical protein